MFSTQQVQPLSRSLLKFATTLQNNVKDWIRQEIVDDDPYDEDASLFQSMIASKGR